MTETKQKVTLIIPTLNEIGGMKWFMSKLKPDWYDDLIVIDGGSTDGTVEYCKEKGYPVYRQSGRGIPIAFSDAFKLSKGDIIITTSPDGNSIPELIPDLVAKMREGYDMTIVSRYLGDAKSEDDDAITGVGNLWFTKMINFLFGGKYTDTLVIYRAYTKDAIEQMQLYNQDYENWLRRKYYLMNSWELGSSIRAAKLKLKVAEIPGDEPKRISGTRKMSIPFNGLGIVLQILHELFVGKRFQKKLKTLMK